MKDPNIPWKISGANLITETGVDCLRRETLELQGKYMGNRKEVLSGDDEPAIDIMERKFMATVLELWTSWMSHLTIW